MRKRYQAPATASSEITSESTYLKRRELIKAAGLAALPAVAGSALAGEKDTGGLPLDYKAAVEAGPAGFYTSEPQTPLADVKAYCNFYEFGMDKGDPARNAHEMTTDPWSISVSGAVNKPGKLNLEDILSGFDLEERIYRFRCVEAWSMVVPWVGFPCPHCWSASSLPTTPGSSNSVPFTVVLKCPALARLPASLTGLIAKDCVWMRRCTR